MLWSGQASLEEEAEEAEAEEKIRLKQYVSLHSKGRHNYFPDEEQNGPHQTTAIDWTTNFRLIFS